MLRPWNQAARSLIRRPAFAVAAVLILGAGIAATTGVFSIVDATLLEPLPYPHPDRLVLVMEANSAKSDAVALLAPGRLEDWNRRNQTFVAISGSYAENVTETSGDVPERLAARRTSPRFFKVYDVHPSVGRTFTPVEEVDGGPAAAVISDQFWARRYQRRATVTSEHLILKGQSYAIVAVMPPDFAPNGIDLWIPAQPSAGMLAVRDARFLTGIGRVKPGVTIAAAQHDLARVQMELGQVFPATDRNWSAQVTDLATSRNGEVRQPLLFVLGSVVLLLLIAVANTAGLVLAQLQHREHELAIRGFLGATRGEVVVGVVQEVLIIAGVAIAVAVAADLVLLRVGSATFASLPRASAVGVDWRALAVASLSGVGAALACGALPAWRATRGAIAAAISRAGRGTSASGRWQGVLVAGQIAIATLLLCSTALMLRSYYNLTHENPGFDASHSVTFHVGAAWDEDRIAVGSMQRDLLAELARLPGVTSAGFANFLPASNATIRYRVRLENGTPVAGTNDENLLTVGQRSVTKGYFAALGAPLIAGTTCPDIAVVRNSGPKVLVNRRFVTTYANGQSLVGRFLRWEQDRATAPNTEIVGIVADIREDNLRSPAVPYVYQCLAPGDWPDPEYVVRTAGDPRALIGAIRSTVRRFEPTRAVFGLSTLADNLDATLEQARLQTGLISAFGIAAVALAVLGLYALVALAVTTRRREIGIRIALGADSRRVVWELATRVGWLLAGGTASGLLMTAIAQRQLRAMVFGVAPLDPATLAGAVLALGTAASLATVVPAWRAARIDPVSAMRDGS
jgi:putative ABC transport system permease protein